MREGRDYVSIPGHKMHQLPPLLVRRASEGAPVDMALAIEEAGDMLPEVINERLVHAGVPVAGLDTPRRSLEDEFVHLTGEGFDVD